MTKLKYAAIAFLGGFLIASGIRIAISAIGDIIALGPKEEFRVDRAGNIISAGTRITMGGNVRGRPVAPAGVGSHTVTFAVARPTALYSVQVTPTWNTVAWVTAPTTAGFTVNFSVLAPSFATYYWLVID